MIESIKTIFHNLRNLIHGDSTKRQIFKGSVGSLIINIGNKILVMLSGILLVRILGKAEYGIYSYILSLVFVFIIPIEYGLSNLIVRETAQGIAQQKNDLIIGVWRWSLNLTLILCAFLVLASAVGMIWAVDRFSQDEITAYLWALSLIPFQTLVMLASAGLRGLKSVILGQLADLIILPSVFVILLLVFHLTYPVLNAACAMALRALATGIAFVFSIIFLIRKTPKSWRNVQPNYRKRYWFASALPLGLSSGLGMVKTRITLLLMAFFVTAAQIGTFQVAVSAASLAGLVLQAANAALAPQFASLYIQEKTKALQKLVTINTRIVLVFNLLATLIFVLFGKFLLSFVFGPDLVDAYPSVLIMLIGQLCNAFVGSVAFLLNMTGHEKDVMTVIGLSVSVNVVLALAFTPIWGIIGGAISTSVSLILAQVVMAVLVFKRLGIISHPFIKV